MPIGRGLAARYEGGEGLAGWDSPALLCPGAPQARAEGAKLILTGRSPKRLQLAADEVQALSITAFDADDPAALERFFHDLPAPIDHVMVTAGRPHCGRLLETDLEQARRAFDTHLMLMLQVARNAAHKVKRGGTLLFMGGTGGRRIGPGMGIRGAGVNPAAMHDGMRARKNTQAHKSRAKRDITGRYLRVRHQINRRSAINLRKSHYRNSDHR